MNRPTFQEKAEVKVVDKDYCEYTCIKGVEKTVPMYGMAGDSYAQSMYVRI